MKTVRVVLVFILISVLISCNTFSTNHKSGFQTNNKIKYPKVISPFTQFETIKRGENGISSEQVDNILQSYFIYDKIKEKMNNDFFVGSFFSNIKISGFYIGDKQVAVLLIEKGHISIYVMFSNSGDDKWVVSGFVHQNERKKSEYRIEQSSDGIRYWLVVNNEANHGTGTQIYNEIWYNPDGSVAAEYPIEGSTFFFPELIKPSADTYFSTAVDYDGESAISLSYSISFMYHYKGSFQNHPGYVYKFQSKYSPVLREYWEYNLKTQQLRFISCDPPLSESFSTMNREMSADFGILQGYIDFYKTRLSNKQITTLAEWERFMELE